MPVVFAYRDLILSCPMAELPGVVSKLTFKDLPDVERVCQRASKLVASTPRAFRADLYVRPACASLLEPGWPTGADVASLPRRNRVCYSRAPPAKLAARLDARMCMATHAWELAADYSSASDTRRDGGVGGDRHAGGGGAAPAGGLTMGQVNVEAGGDLYDSDDDGAGGGADTAPIRYLVIDCRPQEEVRVV